MPNIVGCQLMHSVQAYSNSGPALLLQLAAAAAAVCTLCCTPDKFYVT